MDVMPLGDPKLPQLLRKCHRMLAAERHHMPTPNVEMLSRLVVASAVAVLVALAACPSDAVSWPKLDDPRPAFARQFMAWCVRRRGTGGGLCGVRPIADMSLLAGPSKWG